MNGWDGMGLGMNLSDDEVGRWISAHVNHNVNGVGNGSDGGAGSGGGGVGKDGTAVPRQPASAPLPTTNA